MKGIFKRISNKKINKFLRTSRRIYYAFFDLCGEVVFATLRFLRIIAPISDFKQDSVRNILIIRIDRLGDLILSTPAIRAVRETFPQARVHLLVLDYAKDLVIRNPNINKLLVYERDSIANDYDLSIALHPGFRPNFITFISGARYRVGYLGWGGGFFLTHKVADDRSVRVRHEAESALEVVGKVGCVTYNKDAEVSITEEGERFAERFFRENQIQAHDTVVIVHPGARHGYVRWRKEGFAEVSDRLIRQEKAKVILTANNTEEKLIEDVVSLMHEKPLIALGFQLTHLVSIMKRAKLFVGNATGPMHIAVALKIPVVTIFGVVNALDCSSTWGPWGEGHITIYTKLLCPDCHPSDCKTLECMQSISADGVLEAARKQLNMKR